MSKIKNWEINAINDNFIGYDHKSGNISIYAEIMTDIDYFKYTGEWIVNVSSRTKKRKSQYIIEDKIIKSDRYGKKVKKFIIDWIRKHPFDDEPMTREFYYLFERNDSTKEKPIFFCHLCNHSVTKPVHVRTGFHKDTNRVLLGAMLN